MYDVPWSIIHLSTWDVYPERRLGAYILTALLWQVLKHSCFSILEPFCNVLTFTEVINNDCVEGQEKGSRIRTMGFFQLTVEIPGGWSVSEQPGSWSKPVGGQSNKNVNNCFESSNNGKSSTPKCALSSSKNNHESSSGLMSQSYLLRQATPSASVSNCHCIGCTGIGQDSPEEISIVSVSMAPCVDGME